MICNDVFESVFKEMCDEYEKQKNNDIEKLKMYAKIFRGMSDACDKLCNCIEKEDCTDEEFKEALENYKINVSIMLQIR